MPFEAKAELKEKEAMLRGMEVMSVTAVARRKERVDNIVGLDLEEEVELLRE